GVDEGEVQFGGEVAAALRTGGRAGTAAPAAAVGATEQAAEQVAEVVDAEVGVEAPATAAAEDVADGSELAELVVLLALVGVADDGVGLGDLLEFRLRRRVTRPGVGVVLLGQLAVGARDLLLGRGVG